MEQTSNFQNNSNSDDTNIKEVVKKCLIMFENTIITIEYVSFKINVLSKSVEEFEQLEKYLLDEEKVRILEKKKKPTRLCKHIKF